MWNCGTLGPKWPLFTQHTAIRLSRLLTWHQSTAFHGPTKYTLGVALRRTNKHAILCVSQRGHFHDSKRIFSVLFAVDLHPTGPVLPQSNRVAFQNTATTSSGKAIVNNRSAAENLIAFGQVTFPLSNVITDSRKIYWMENSKLQIQQPHVRLHWAMVQRPQEHCSRNLRPRRERASRTSPGRQRRLLHL